MFSEKVLIEKENSTALKDDKGYSLSFGELWGFCDDFNHRFSLCGRELVLVLCENTVPCAAVFFACIINKAVPILLSSRIDKDMLERYISIYRPNYIFKPKKTEISCCNLFVNDYFDYEMVKTAEEALPMSEELSFLLPTSGTTGNPKLVRHSYHNLSTSVESVAKTFRLCGDEYALLSLPIHFTQGLSVLCSTIYAGSRVFLTDLPLTRREFWNIMKEEEITSFSGVPYSFEVLDKLRFYTMNLPALKVINQGGGRMPDELFKKLSSYAADNGKEFYATYGATETTSRMSCLEPGYTSEKCGSVGTPLPGYEMWLVDESGEQITTPNIRGELIFKGGNVTLGYADSAEDLVKGDERYGIYETGDLAYRDKDGFYYITGRLSRFIKIFGYRINLDETERLIKSEFNGDFACVGNDEKLYLFTNDKHTDTKDFLVFLKNKLKINISAFEAIYIDDIPKKLNGKTDYNQLNHLVFRKEGI